MSRKAPLIASPAGRSAAVAVLMLGLLAGSLGLSSWLTGAKWMGGAGPEPVRASIGGATLELPGTWVFDDEASTPGGASPRWSFVNTTAPAQRLTVWRLTFAEPVEPTQVIGRAVASSMVRRSVRVTPEERRPFRLNDRSPSLSRGGALVDLVFTSQRIAQAPTPPELNAIAVFTPDRRRYWVYRFTNPVPVERWDRQMEAEHLERLRRWVDGVSYDPVS
ncbi:MAG: hypothetical protein AAFX76_00115 [Planctomycetota bacterium]